MTAVLRLEAAIREPKHGKTAVMPYITAGYPSREAFVADVERISEVSDAIEIGVPFSDPMADGVTIQNSSRASLAAGTTLPWILSSLTEARPSCPLVLMSYLNPLLAYGLERLALDAASAGISAFIVPDLPWEEGLELRALAEREGLGVVQLVTPLTPPARLAMLCEGSKGFVYAVTVAGVTGAGLNAGVEAYLGRVKAASKVPVCAGFGVRDASDVARLGAEADGVIVGSALIEAWGRGADPVAFVQALR